MVKNFVNIVNGWQWLAMVNGDLCQRHVVITMAGVDDIVIKLFAPELFLFFDWLMANTWEIIDRSYQLSDTAEGHWSNLI